MSPQTPTSKSRTPQRDRRVDKGIALAAAAVLEQVFQWHSDLAPVRKGVREAGRFDVQAVFDALNDK